ncbi:MAG: deoxyribonuclease IV [Candidatus Omnitrophica bacterium CG11_big_fil_rev_8_21_14_0_20_64_10]|nr:MAG: deoxyribonuclease IV [Candidatus Omnitrophica bacterium CG11_big_fil_rev_8_21_14_0_20_64_10]
MRLGAHMSVAGGFEKAIERGTEVGCRTIQLFTKSNNQWRAAPISAEQADTFRKAWKASPIGPILSHTAYLINIGSPNPETFEKSKAALLVEMQRAETLGLDFLVLHPGARLDSDEKACLKQIAKTAAWVIRQTPKASVRLLYETSAGQGSTVGHTFEQLAELLAQTGAPDRTGICLDTCHIFAAGYDIRTPAAYEKTMKHFDRTVGLAQVRAVHLNDSKKELNCRVDRHEHIGQGKIGLAGFRCLLSDSRLNRAPMVLETPKDETCAEDKMNLKVLRGLIGRG